VNSNTPRAAAKRRPSQAEIAAAHGRHVPDVIAPALDILFCGINPSLYSAAVGHHFARPGNRFWPTLHRAGFTPRQLQPEEDRLLPEYGLGVTNLVDRATASAAELSAAELREGAQMLQHKLERYQPRVLAVLGISAYRSAFGQSKAQLGRQPERIAAVPVWVLPNPSGLNAHYQLAALTAIYGELRAAVDSGR
jgi:TDG/mug DNA glycosylase family protein